MAQEDKGGSNLPIASIVALVLFASGMWVQYEPLHSDRPGVLLKQEKADQEVKVQQDVEARLWQDPLEAVKRAESEGARDEKADREAQARRQPNAFREWVGQSRGRARMVLPVLMFGGPYAEDAEQRRRARHAVLSGLRESGYEPDTSRGIGYVRFDSPRMLVPFERWLRIDTSAERKEEVYVLWVAEETLGRKPVDRLFEVLDLLLPDDPTLAVTVLGPQSDRVAVAVARQLAAQSGGAPAVETAAGVLLTRGTRTVRMIAPALSFPARTLVRRTVRVDPALAREGEQRLMDRIGPELERMRVGPDDAQLARLLVGELANRDIDLPLKKGDKCKDQVALVVEADTHYARSLQREVIEHLKPCKDSFPPMTLHYFRGLDGRVASDDGDNKQGDNGDKKKQQQSTPYQERAYGQGQFDYLRRMAAELRRRSDEQQRLVRQQDGATDADNSTSNGGLEIDPGAATSRGSVRAVIVLGSDIHDKLAVLHALRESLPLAVFATTDLDAGMLHKEQLAWTRNVLVASGFDLRAPGAHLQKGAPLFRDTYQTAIFIATRQALAAPSFKPDANVLAEAKGEMRKVMLFEIGNQTPVHLASSAPDARNPAPRPLGASSGLGQSWQLAGLGLLALAVFGFAINYRLRQLAMELLQRKPGTVRLAVAALLVALYFLAVVLCIGQLSNRVDEEPLRWFAGVSVWPAALICHVAGALALLFFMLGLHRLRNGEAEIEREFFAPDQTDATEKQAGSSAPEGKRRWFGEFQDSWFPARVGPAPTATNHAWRTWLRYRGWGQGRNCRWRLGLGVVAVFALMVIAIMDIGWPVSPVRGKLSPSLYHLMILPGYLLTLALLVWTLDRVALCTLFLHRLYGSDDAPRRSGWHDDTQKRFCGCSALNGGANAGNGAASEDAEAVESYIDLRLTARLSEHVGGIVVYPFVLLLLLIVARARYFDNWGITLGHLSIIGLILALLITAAFTLRHNAERIRRYTVEQFESMEVRMLAQGYRSTTDATRDQIAKMKAIAINLREGAFAPFSSQPIVRAVLLPFGGAGLINLMDFFLA